MSFLPNSPNAGGGPVTFEQILAKLAETHLDTTEDYLNRLAEWRAHGAITEEILFLADQALMQQADHFRAVISNCGLPVRHTIR